MHIINQRRNCFNLLKKRKSDLAGFANNFEVWERLWKLDVLLGILEIPLWFFINNILLKDGLLNANFEEKITRRQKGINIQSMHTALLKLSKKGQISPNLLTTLRYGRG